MGEGQVDYEEIDLVTPISGDEFETVWNTNLAQHEATWSASKSRYSLHEMIRGHIRIFYPQGVIVKLDTTTLGVIAYDTYQQAPGNAVRGTGIMLTATVAGYDERNHWIILSQPLIGE